jgi:hypothetical protein
MALDRTWYNTLLDDDGSGMTGSVWDKADVDSLMDAVDAEIARMDAAALKVLTGTWTPYFLGSGGNAGQTYGSQSGSYLKIDRVVLVNFGLVLSVLGTFTGTVSIGNLPFTVGPIQSTGTIFWAALAAQATVVAYAAPGTTLINLWGAPGGAVATLAQLTQASMTASATISGSLLYRANA